MLNISYIALSKAFQDDDDKNNTNFKINHQ